MRAFYHGCPKDDADHALEDARSTFSANVQPSKRSDRQALLATGLVMSDLAAQGWLLRVRGNRVEVAPQRRLTGDQGRRRFAFDGRNS